MHNNHPPPTVGPPPELVTRAEFNELRILLHGMHRRAVRTETRIMRLLEHHGLDASGQKTDSECARTPVST